MNPQENEPRRNEYGPNSGFDIPEVISSIPLSKIPENQLTHFEKEELRKWRESQKSSGAQSSSSLLSEPSLTLASRREPPPLPLGLTALPPSPRLAEKTAELQASQIAAPSIPPSTTLASSLSSSSSSQRNTSKAKETQQYETSEEQPSRISDQQYMLAFSQYKVLYVSMAPTGYTPEQIAAQINKLLTTVFKGKDIPTVTEDQVTELQEVITKTRKEKRQAYKDFKEDKDSKKFSTRMAALNKSAERLLI